MTRPASPITRRRFGAAALAAGCALPLAARAQALCGKPIYLTFDTGHMGVAPLIARALARHRVQATFFAANERTQEGDGSLGEHWAPWWRERAAEGHEFASHTFDQVYWRADLPGEPASFRVQASAGPKEGVVQTWSAARYCSEIDRGAQRLQQLTGRKPLPLFRAARGHCLSVAGFRTAAGRNRDDETGFLVIADCRLGAEGPGMAVELGWSKNPAVGREYKGGMVRGIIAPDSVSRMRLVSTTPGPGLVASALPSPDSIPNNHLGYAVQWFLFAAAAALIYVLALKRRERDAGAKHG